ncbi:Cytochrome c, mono-and diheme variants [Thalassovita gelatinovora]|uniref:Cytochrome c, mono-and diheme variants n=1 Tax=Thalassovita gelatinovora TaxID=53501 RepID=A0A0P1F7M1_THAGE|nr:c-type cytochrome [Thalassovita gelatinovora]QIZ80205.1 c-type cytochrome [Thalassovita gelatinovora]CUH64044.1 Cytochrome c, mono-and diheme variants [Thalassovita gelatinovora]SEQ82201.1 Cytochrome C oxidase, cbb3-type, subunit III [Thalassovita gelatinovora]
MKPKVILSALAASALLTACVENSMPEADEGAALYANNCAICHGSTGRGDGELAKSLRPAPSDLTAITRRYGTFPRAHVLSVIDGYTRMENPGDDMPEFGLLLEGDTVPVDIGDGTFSPVPRPLAALLVYLESIQQ